MMSGDPWADELSVLGSNLVGAPAADETRPDGRRTTALNAALSAHRKRTLANARESRWKKRPAAANDGMNLPKVPEHVTADLMKPTVTTSFPLGNFIKRITHSNQIHDPDRSAASTASKMARLWDWCMNKRLSASLSVAANWVGCTTEEVKRYSRRLAALILHHDYSCRVQVENNSARATDRKRLVVCDNNTEDETPMNLAVLQQFQAPPEFIRQVACSGVDTLTVQSADMPKHLAIKSQVKNFGQAGAE